MKRADIDYYCQLAADAVTALRARVPITSAVLDFWGGAVRIIYGSPGIATCDSRCESCDLFLLVGPDTSESQSQGFVTTLVPASSRQLETFQAKQRYLNCKAFDQYLEAFVAYLVTRCETDAALHAELDLVKGFRILYLDGRDDLAAAERQSKTWIVNETLRRLAPSDPRRGVIAQYAQDIGLDPGD